MDRKLVRRLPALAALLLLAACGAGHGLLGPDAPQGIEGLVLLGPLCPVVTAEDPCPDRPYQATIEVLDADGDRVTSVRSDLDGRFRVGLEPGLYRLHPESGDPLPAAGDQDVEVRARAWSAVTVGYDTGIR
jgi:hypothetical protein